MTASSPGIWFVHRSHHDGPLGKRVRRLAAPSVLAWFQAQLEEARIATTPQDIAKKELGGPVHGLGALFEAAKKHSLHTPKSTTALAKLLHEHLHVDHADNARVDAHAVRVVTTNERGDLAWFFLDDEAASRSPRQLAFLLHDEPQLPEGDADRPFAAAPLPIASPAGSGEGATYLTTSTSHGRRSLPGRAIVIPGVRLPELAAHLARITPDVDPAHADGHEGWPIELRVLRAMIDPAAPDLAAALRKVATFPVGAVAEKADSAHVGVGPHEAARAELEAAGRGLGRPAGEPVVFASGHAAMLSAALSTKPGVEQWILFDDRWAAANPDLATSILHYADHADPFAPLRATRLPAAPKTAAKDKGDKPAKAKAERSQKAKEKAEKAAATKDEKAWKAALGDRDQAAAEAYKPTARFAGGALVAHTKFGVGVVTRVEGGKCEVLFKDGPRLLVQGT